MPPTEVRDSAGGADRSWSVDLFRGVVMFLLIGEATGFYELLTGPGVRGAWLQALAGQFQHHPWHGLRLWDLGLPFFMFISGVALVLSYEKRWARGETWAATCRQAARRALTLFALGWAPSKINPIENGSKGEFLLDVLPQLALAGLLGFLALRRPAWVQALFAIGLVLMTDLLFRFWAAPGFDQPFVPGRNFGSYIDLQLFGRLSDGNWVTFNIIPSVAFVFAGLLAGHWLKAERPRSRILLGLVGAGLSGVILGVALDPLAPVIRRISTGSFVILSIGLGLLALALAYWLIEVLGVRKGKAFFVCLGMNPIFIYIFAFSGGADWLRGLVGPFVSGAVGPGRALAGQTIEALSVWGLMWALCYWLYRKKIFVRI